MDIEEENFEQLYNDIYEKENNIPNKNQDDNKHIKKERKIKKKN